MKTYNWLTNIFCIAALFAMPLTIYAHPGNTDSSGCHTCRTNCGDWGLSYGEYHCHNNTGSTQPIYPVTSTYGAGGTGYTTPAPDYAYPSYPTTPSCPSMSSYDSLSGNCKCYSGYVVGTDYSGKEACVSADSKCTDSFGYGSRYNSLSEKCECRYGHLFNGSKCVSESLYCSDKLGIMSQYNSSTEQCECMSGYEFNGYSCTYKKTNYSNTSTYSPYSSTPSNCPLNSHESPSDSTMCTCDTGYQINSAKNACIIIPTKTNNQICQDSFGLNVDWDGTKTNDGQLNCNCKTGYQWNGDRTICVVIPIKTTPPVNVNIQTNKNIEPDESTKEKPTSKDFIPKDSDFTIFKGVGILKTSATFRRCPSTECSTIRYYAETSQLQISGKTLSGDWYRIDGTTDAGGDGQKIIGWIHKSLFEQISLSNDTLTKPTEIKTNKQSWFARFINWFK